MKNLKNTSSSGFTRREFIGTTAMAAGAMAFTPAGINSRIFSTDKIIRSASYTPLNVKFVHTGAIHEAAYEGSCRHGKLKNLSMEAETEFMKKGLKSFNQEIQATTFGPGIKILGPQGVYLWIEKGNPEIMLTDDELFKLKGEDPETDVYVVTGGLPQFTCVRIAETFRKPVLYINIAGWGLDVPAGVRALGQESYYVQNMQQLKDLLMVYKARKAIQQTKFLNVTNFKEVPKGVISSISNLDSLKDYYGMDYQTVDYGEFFPEMDRFLEDREMLKKADTLADELISKASGINMSKEDIANSFKFYLTILHFFDKYDCNAFGIECFELCSSLEPWQRRFTPCMTHSLLKNSGFPSACEKDVSALLAMAVMMYISHKPAYMGNPDLFLDENILRLHHSDSPTKMTGIDQPDDYYEIKSFTEAGFGATLRYDYEAHKGQVVTLSRFDPTAKKILVTSGPISGGGGLEGYGCSQTVSIQIPDGKEMMRKMQDFGHHMAMVYGNLTEQIRDLGDLMNFEVVVV